MKHKTILLAIWGITFFACNGDVSKETNTPVQNNTVPDDAAIQQAVQDAYACISFKKGDSISEEKIRAAFIPHARLLNYRNDSLEELSLDQFIQLFQQLVNSHQITSFYEEELFGRTDQFGNIAQRISTYKTYLNTMDSVSERGINSFQLIKTSDGWKVSSIIWDVEKKGQPIPAYYLPAP